MKKHFTFLLAICCLFTSCHAPEQQTPGSSLTETTVNTIERTSDTSVMVETTEQTTDTSKTIDDDSYLYNRTFRYRDVTYFFEHQGGDRNHLLLTEVSYSGEVLLVPAEFSDARGTVAVKEIYFSTVFDTCIHTKRFVFEEGITALLSHTEFFPDYIWSANAVEEIYMPASVSQIDAAALPPYLKKLEIAENNPYYSVKENDSIYYLYDQNDNLIYQTKDRYAIDSQSSQ